MSADARASDRPRGLARLLRPSSIAVIGGGAWCANVIEQCRKIGFSGEIWPVHPARATIGGIAAYRCIDDLPEAPDASFIGINRDASIEALRTLAARGSGGAVCFASGFREAQAETGDGASKQAALLEAAGGMTILGPNCYGFLNYLDGVALWPDQHGGRRVSEGVAIISQSSNIAINITMQTRGLPVAYVVTVGNQAQTSLADVATSLLADPRVTAVGLYVEGIGNLRAFEAMAEAARAAGKPIVALKAGISSQAQTATLSHTASLAGSDAGASALLRRLGIARVTSIPALIQALTVLHVAGPLRSNRLAVMACSGGEASLMADTLHGSGLDLPALSPAQSEGLRAALGLHVALANPLDYHTFIWGDEDALAATFGAMVSGDVALGIVVIDFPRPDLCDRAAWEIVIAAVARAQAAAGRPMALLASLAEALPEDIALRLVAQGIVPLAGFTEAVEALERAAWLGQDWAVPPPIFAAPAVKPGPALTEAEAKTALAAHGMSIPIARRAGSPDAAAEAAREIGFPVVLKGEGVAHKTEAGAVVLGLGSDTAVRDAARNMEATSFLVEEMVVDAVAELLIGAVADPAHGYVLTLAAGGTATELLQDSASVLIPASRTEVAAALGGLRLAPLLRGYRGRPPAEWEAILDAVDALQAYVIAQQPHEVEVNPLLCGRKRAVAADALIKPGDTA
ncbi:MAG: acetate--CoA ligase family protein [Pseudomonadota bacterium]